MFRFKVVDQTLTMIEQPLVISDTIDYLTAEFEFSSDWTGLDKWVHFKQGDTIYDFNLVDDKIKDSMHLNLSAGKWRIYVHGCKYVGTSTVKRITTSTVYFTVKKSDALEGQPLPTVSPSATEQILAKVSNAESKIVTAQQSATSASTSASSAQTSAQNAATSASQAQTLAQSAQTIAQQAQSTASSKYTKPSSGIPKTDLASAVQTSLGKADTALQEHQSLSAYRTASEQDEIDNGLAEDINELVDTKYEKPIGGIPSTDMTEAVQTSLGKADTALQEHQSLSAYRTASAQDLLDAEKVSDIKINGTSIVQDGVGNIPKGSANGLGVLGVWSGGGTDVAADGTIKLQRATDENIINRDNYYRPIVSKNLDFAVKRSLTDGIAPDWSEAEQKACRKRIGEDKYELIEEIVLTEDTNTITRTQEPDGTAYNFKSLVCHIVSEASTAQNSLTYRINDTWMGATMTPVATTGKRYSVFKADVIGGRVFAQSNYTGGAASDSLTTVGARCMNACGLKEAPNGIAKFNTVNCTLPAGTTIKIYAIRA